MNVAQEVANAKSITILCRNQSLCWNKIIQGSYLIKQSLHLEEAHTGLRFENWITRVICFQELRWLALEANDHLQTNRAGKWARDVTQEPYCYLPFLFCLLSGMNCTDKRDHVYAFYGLLRWIFPKQNCVNLVVEYTLSVKDAYTRVTSIIPNNSDYLPITGY